MGFWKSTVKLTGLYMLERVALFLGVILASISLLSTLILLAGHLYWWILISIPLMCLGIFLMFLERAIHHQLHKDKYGHRYNKWR